MYGGVKCVGLEKVFQFQSKEGWPHAKSHHHPNGPVRCDFTLLRFSRKEIVAILVKKYC